MRRWNFLHIGFGPGLAGLVVDNIIILYYILYTRTDSPRILHEFRRVRFPRVTGHIIIHITRVYYHTCSCDRRRSGDTARRCNRIVVVIVAVIICVYNMRIIAFKTNRC